MKNNPLAGKIITRFPPSPTGPVHMGNVRTAIFNYIFAKQNDGIFLFRSEDTDKERSKREYEESLIENMHWLGITWDNQNFTRQSERGDVYCSYLEKLVREKKAYVSKEDTGGDATKRGEVIRFKNPNKKITFTDLIRGEIIFDTTELGDFIIAKSMTEPIYHLAVVIDDFESHITHIIRGEDHISNTPRQILIQEAIGAPRPFYAHLPMVLATDKSKLSKRKHGESVSLNFYRNKGYLPDAVINFLALLGWNPGTEQEIFSMSELIEQFDISKIQKSGAIFNIEKLNWFNKEYLKKLDPKIIIAEIKKRVEKKYPITEEYAQKLLPVISDRINVYSDIDTMTEAGELDCFFNEPEYPKEKLLWKGESDPALTASRLKKVSEMLSANPWESAAEVKALLMPYADKEGKGSVLWPVRYALSGKDKSPDPFTLISILGKQKTTNRLTRAVTMLS